ncbi:class II glutamine amidotransferase [Thalassomonas sp. M1454]|uniref:class II glutamine amidotransferase n=1 Tax=Thalassomonas sp. M1454 TaxID=2594477 RepID=UPI00117DD951|nr:class II glutamine amidotransferase [Thalassomonas sp. M1454]TRX57002.1 class II glutamine amidotransferase [Thalassomonas sp. M1454]
MCELLAMSANVPTDICFSFAGLMQRGGNTGPHKDGWGVTFYEGKGCRTFKDPQPSYDSEIARLVTNYPIKSEAVVCHIRQANAGPVCLENTHPFTRELWGRNFTYAHNGQLANFKELLTTESLSAIGSTDSEQAFCWILEKLRLEFGNERPSNDLLFPFIASLAEQINKLGVFNLILSDGDFIFAYCSNNLHWITRRAPFGPAKLIDADVAIDFKKETTDKDIVTVIATQPLTLNEKWQKMQAGDWHVFIHGEKLI